MPTFKEEAATPMSGSIPRRLARRSWHRGAARRPPVVTKLNTEINAALTLSRSCRAHVQEASLRADDQHTRGNSEHVLLAVQAGRWPPIIKAAGLKRRSSRTNLSAVTTTNAWLASPRCLPSSVALESRRGRAAGAR